MYDDIVGLEDEIPSEISAALEAVQAIVPRLLRNSSGNITSGEYISPFVLYVVYKAATVHLVIYRARLDMSSIVSFKTLKETLMILNGRWGSAGMVAG